MFRFILIVFAVCFLKDIDAACLASYREPCTFQSTCPCAFAESVSGVISCPSACSATSNQLCNCGLPACSCFKDTAKVCDTCHAKKSPMCSCLANLDVGCDCDAKKSFIYFPEVEYPLSLIEMNPLFFNTCWFP
ncbi:uncharacterized protein LOC128202242 [Galleria mellonella]|uniref:Uncharacterized protein LOC116413666 n=1 Tax=Galleria mellonella TaxID=7137 RepID=A0A6J3CDY4_GALME|nr:uncharacterized protein LOC116413666 [Galleria mellonella]XP_052757791.1 uncharacterized protein LOC128202242 [Galleria mellonella]